ncbi:FtsK/SpoIIIE domain-containing protein [Actinomyces sp.]|uniref:FtsK/SpoIIIE domain-containing protein n=1 Tax=Actinomyces sp. TaxID=29317 RepID=UPI002914B5C9|nr:FtsK/SpoIIIE domain-containing protein [Actinomyces sp.]MDU5231143.1 FtsK/SpoIIIE domain-containing protein [Actinomyces sp.]MDU6756645.1 FtsK/SpoIIIE domain-containing protein [Actinomyces sp.]
MAEKFVEGLLEPFPLLMLGIAGLGLLLLLFVWVSPSSRLQRSIARFSDGAGITTTSTSMRDGKQVLIKYRLQPFKRRKTEWGYQFLLRPNTGASIEDIVNYQEALRDHLRAREVRVSPSDRPGVALVEVFLRDAAPVAYSRPDLDSGSLPGPGVVIGIKDNGEPFSVSLGHTLIVGATGSGKGSLIWSYLMGVEEYVCRLGGPDLVRFYGWDPKHAELANVGNRLERVGFSPGEGLALLDDLVMLMKQRQSVGRRDFSASKDQPFVLLVIDEFNSIFASTDAKWRKRVIEQLQLLLSQGRSAGIYVVAAAQQPQKEVLGPFRAHFMNRLCLRVETAQEVDLVLGSGSVEAGALSHLIEPATETNGYRTAGIGYARSDAEPVPVRFRAPMVSDREILKWSSRVEEGVSDGF